MYERRAVGDRRFEVDHCGEELVLELDCVERLLRDLLRAGGDGRDHLAFEPHDVAGEQGSVGDPVAVPNVGHVVGGENREHAGECTRRRHVESRDPGVADLGVAELGDEHPGEREIAGVAPGAGDLVGTVGSDELGEVGYGHATASHSDSAAIIIGRAST